MKDPAITETAFRCPYCGAYTTQYWFRLYADAISDKTNNVPMIPNAELIEAIKRDQHMPQECRDEIVASWEKVASGLIFIEPDDTDTYSRLPVSNLHISRCFNCGKFAVWVHENLLYPTQEKQGPTPNQDMPEEIIEDVEEAREVLSLSPRSAAALLRLAIQKLCKHLGKSGKDLNADIGELVGEGLDPRIQQSLDILRVVGNEAVHPGVLDLKDDRETSLQLLEIMNSVVDQMISHPKRVSALYERLPASKRQGIENRDRRKLEK